MFFSRAQYNGCKEKNGTQINGYKTVTIYSNLLKLTEYNVKILNDSHNKNQVNRLNIRVGSGIINK